jgi:hypothetical protein
MARAESNTAAPRATRPRKTAAEKAQIEFDKSTARLAKAGEAVTKAQEAVETAKVELAEAQAQHDYVSRNPALPPQAATEEGTQPVEDGAVTPPA